MRRVYDMLLFHLSFSFFFSLGSLSCSVLSGSLNEVGDENEDEER